MKIYILAFLVILLLPATIISQDLIAITPDKNLSTDGRDDCVSTIISIPTPFLRSDCQDTDQADINISYRFRECFGVVVGSFCDFSHSVIEVNGTTINTVQYGASATNYNEIIEASDYVHLITDASEACFTIRVFKECTLTGTSEIYSATQCVPVLKQGDTHTEIRYGSPIRPETLECLSDPAITVCCKDAPVTISSEVAFSLSSSQSNTVDMTFGEFSVNNNAFRLEFPITYTSSTNLTTTWTEGLSVVRSLTIEPEPGFCKSAALNINFITVYEDIYSVGECDAVLVAGLSHVIGEAVFSVTFTECKSFLCPQEKPALVFSKNIPSYVRDGCMGSIMADIPSDYEGDLKFSWSGPYDFMSNEQNIENVFFGTYTLIVTDDCCNEYEYSYFLCDDIEYGPWQRDSEDLLFCRALQCSVENCEIEDSQECVEPDDVIESYENGKCVEKYYFQGDFLGEAFSDAELKIEYDDVIQKCIKTAKCNADEFIIEEISPSFGNWNFNYGNENCERTIICFNEIVSGKIDTKLADIEESFDLITGLCSRKAYCAIGVPIILPPKPPIISNPWQWTTFQGCTKYVQCSTESGSETVSGSENFTNWSFNSITDMCESEVTCENSWIPGATNSQFPSTTGLWNWSSSRPLHEQCFRTILCGNTTFIEDTTQPTYQTTGIPCGDGLFQYYIICDGVNTLEVGCGSIKEDKIITEKRNESTSMEDEIVKIFPNPTFDNLQFSGLIDTDQYSVEIRNITGQIVQQTILKDNSISIEHLSSGAYFLKLMKNKDTILSKRISKL